MVVFIIVPKNRGLRKYREIALSYLDDLESKKIIEVRGEDVPFWVQEFEKLGKKAIGLTGEDLFKEYSLEERNKRFRIIRKIVWEDPNALFGKPTLCLIGPKDRKLSNLPKTLTVAISSKYKKIAKKYLNFLEEKGYTFKKIYINGCIELSCSEGIADLIIDIVYTGESVKKYGLKIYDKIMESNFVIISNDFQKSVIFDMDGVLIDTSRSYGTAAKKTVEYFLRKDIALEEFQEIKGSGCNNEWDCCEMILRKNNSIIDKKQIVEKFQEFLNQGLINNESLLIKESTLEKLSETAKLAIVTGRPRKEALITLRKYGIENCFSAIITMDDISRQKPDPEGLKLAIKQLSTSDNVYIGDMPADGIMAGSANVRFIGILSPGYPEEFKASLKGAECILRDINQITEILEVKK